MSEMIADGTWPWHILQINEEHKSSEEFLSNLDSAGDFIGSLSNFENVVEDQSSSVRFAHCGCACLCIYCCCFCISFILIISWFALCFFHTFDLPAKFVS